jgi:hypothetical protein
MTKVSYLGSDMKRREFIALLGSAAVIRPFSARAERPLERILYFTYSTGYRHAAVMFYTTGELPMSGAQKKVGTIRNWCVQHHLGRRVGGGTWVVSKVALAMHLDGDLKALRTYHAGDRTSNLVAPYFERAGLRAA